MDIYLPIAEMSVNVFLLLAMGIVGGFLSGMFGVGGGFLLTPLLAFAGVPPSIAVGTQANQLVGTSLAGTLAHWKRKNVDVRMGLTMLLGSVVGTTVGAEIFRWLQRLGHIDLVISLCYVLMLGGIGGMMVAESGRRLWRRKTRASTVTVDQTATVSPVDPAETVTPLVATGWRDRLTMEFPASALRLNILLPIGVGFAGGMLVSLLGVGGGFILVPAMIYILRMPPRLVSGTSLFQIIFTTAFSTILQAVLNHSVDILLAMALLLGSVAGVPFGTRLASRLNPVWARFFLGLIVVGVGAKLLADLMMTPSHPFTLETKLL